MTVHDIRPALHTPAGGLTGLSLRITLAVCRWWFWGLRVDCSSEWDHVISRLEGAISTVADIGTRNELRFLRDLAAEHSERCYGDECALLANINFLRPQAD